MSRFGAVLETLSDQLALPQPARSRVLLEIAGDMEAFFELAREQGRSEDEAERLALEAFHPSSAAVAALVRIHASPLALVLDRLSRRALAVWEWILLAVAIVPAAAVCLSAAADLRIFRTAGWPAWPVAACAVAAGAIVVVKLYQLGLRLDHRARVLRRGLELLLVLVAIPAPFGLMVFAHDLYRSLAALSVTWPNGGSQLFGALLRGSAVMTLSLAVTTLGAVAWFLVTRRVVRIEQQEADLLLELHGKGDDHA